MFFLCTSADRLIVWAKQRRKQEGKTTLSKYTTVCEMNSCITLHLHLQIWQHWWSQQNGVLSNNYFWREQEFSFSLTHPIVGTPYCILDCMVEPDKSEFSTIEWYVFTLQIQEEYSNCSLIQKPLSWHLSNSRTKTVTELPFHVFHQIVAGWSKFSAQGSALPSGCSIFVCT